MNSPLKTKIIWLGLVFSQLILVFLLTTLSKSGRMPEGFPEQTKQILIGMAVLNWILAWIIPTVFIRSIAARSKELKPENLLVIYVVQWAFFESVSLFGFIVGNIQVSVQPMLPFLAAGLLGMVFSFPSNRRAESLAQSFESYRIR